MKTLQVTIIAAFLTGCAGYIGPTNLYEARTAMNHATADFENRARPAVEPVSESIDHGMDRAIGSLGLRGRPPSGATQK